MDELDNTFNEFLNQMEKGNVSKEEAAEKMADGLCLMFLKAAMTRADPTGFMAGQVDLLYRFGMPIKNIPEFMKEFMEFTVRHGKEHYSGNQEQPVKFDPGELERLMRNEMNDN